jgi:signal transduction histidine kinase
MKNRFTLSFKYSLFLILFTFLLLLAISSFVFISGRNLIVKESKQELSSYQILIKEGIEREIKASILELKLLNSQFPTGTENIPQFIKNYTDKYYSIDFWNEQNKKYYRVSPKVVFGGQLQVVIDTFDFEILPEYFKQKDGSQVITDEIEKGERILPLLIRPSVNMPYYLKAALSIDYLINENIKMFNFNPAINIIVFNHAGTILFSKNNKDINLNINQRYPVNINHLAGGTTKQWLEANTLLSYSSLYPPMNNILILKELNEDFHRNRAIIGRIFIFGFIVLLFVLAFVGISARKLTHSLNKITRVSKRVSEGDFSQKINLKRRDEIGILIDSFNKMVDKLNQTFKELDDANLRLKDNIRELKLTKQELSKKEKLALIGETVSKISHEIQNKIGGISIWIQNLELYQKNDRTIKEYTSEMRRTLNSFLKMLNNFKKFYREQQLNLQKVKIHELISKSINFYNSEISSRKIKINLYFEEEDLFIELDKAKFDEVFTNILINSLYYAPKNSNLDIIGKVEDGFFILKVIDDGPGVSEEIKDKVFQPFFSTKSGGSGLGLAISYNIVKAHKGQIDLENMTYRGACVTIKLPC